jgi:hypothetical protein
MVRNNGIQTVVNLRGCAPPLRWYMEESRATHDMNLVQEDIAFAANRFPSLSEVRRLVEVLDRSAYPILLHCRQGADRSGLAAAIARLLQPGVTVRQATEQLGWRYGHIPLAHSIWLDRFLECYATWLISHHRIHTPSAFRKWLSGQQCPGPYRCQIDLQSPVPTIASDEPGIVCVRIRNTGTDFWRFKPDPNAGNHCVFWILDQDENGVASGRFGLFDQRVSPGEAIDLQLVIPPLHKPGLYRMLIDMADEQHCWFHQTGAEPLEAELIVHEGKGL